MSSLQLPSKECKLKLYKPKLYLNHVSNYIRRTTCKFRRQGVELTLNLVEEEMAFEYFFRFVSGGNTVGGLLMSLLLKGNDSYCHFLSRQEKKNRELGVKPPKIVSIKPFPC